MHRSRSKRALRWRFIITYTIVPIIIASVSTLLVLLILGYRFDPSDNSVEQGGLVQFDSRPNGATASLDETIISGKTGTKTAATAGSHTVSMSRQGYQTWQKTISVEPGEIVWLNYAYLIPKNIETEELYTYKQIDSSIAAYDEERMLVWPDKTKPVFDIVKTDGGDGPRTAGRTLPTSLYTADKRATFTPIKWDDSGRNALVRYTAGKTTEWLMVDTTAPANSQNITRLLKAEPSQLLFDSEDSNALYALVNGDVRRVHYGNKTVSPTIIEDVATISESDNGIVSYVSTYDKTKKQRTVGYYTPGASQPKTIRTFYDNGKPQLKIKIGEYARKQYIALQYGSSLGISTVSLHPSDSGKDLQLSNIASLSLPEGADSLSFSPSSRFVVAQDGARFTTYDLELEALSSGELGGKTPLRWLDPFTVQSTREGQLYTQEFDGANGHAITDMVRGQAAIRSDNARYIYSVQKTDKNTMSVVRSRMILP